MIIARLSGKIIAAGSGKVLDSGKKVALEVKAGDRVLFSKYAGTEVEIDGKEHLIMREDDILGVIEKAKEGKGAFGFNALTEKYEDLIETKAIWLQEAQSHFLQPLAAYASSSHTFLGFSNRIL